jgi:hypothetical protein
MPNAEGRRPKASRSPLSRVQSLSAFGIRHWALFGLALTVPAAACAPDPERARLERTTQATYDPKTGRLQRLTYDADKNGRIDTWTYMDGKTVLRSEIDRDEDGKIDRWEFHGPDGSLEAIRAEEDGDADGKPDKWETYAGGRISSVAFDENADGRPDRRLNYGPDGALVSIDSEPDASGKFTRKVDVK